MEAAKQCRDRLEKSFQQFILAAMIDSTVLVSMTTSRKIWRTSCYTYLHLHLFVFCCRQEMKPKHTNLALHATDMVHHVPPISIRVLRNFFTHFI